MVGWIEKYTIIIIIIIIIVVIIITILGQGGDTEYLDDVEIFDGRRWKRANYKLDQVR